MHRTYKFGVCNEKLDLNNRTKFESILYLDRSEIWGTGKKIST